MIPVSQDMIDCRLYNTAIFSFSDKYSTTKNFSDPVFSYYLHTHDCALRGVYYNMPFLTEKTRQKYDMSTYPRYPQQIQVFPSV
jgi:hypothetical protein